jgi:hypothetical protein
VPRDLLGVAFQLRPEATPPTVRREGDRILVWPNDARMRVPGREAEADVALGYGDTALIGGASMMVGAEVDLVLEVRNAFGNTRRVAYQPVVRPSAPAPEPRAALEVQ